MERARRLGPRAPDVPRSHFGGFHERMADAPPAMRLVNYECCNPAPGSAVVRHWHHEVGCGANDRAVVVGDEDISSRIGEHAHERSA